MPAEGSDQESPSRNQLNASPSQNVIILSNDMAQKNLLAKKKKLTADQLNVTSKLELNKKESQKMLKENEYTDDDFENSDLVNTELSKKKLKKIIETNQNKPETSRGEETLLA